MIVQKPEIIPEARPQQIIHRDYEEEKASFVNDAESTTMCRYCGSNISQKDEQAQNVGMFMETQCFHVYHISCFKQYAAKVCLRYKR